MLFDDYFCSFFKLFNILGIKLAELGGELRFGGRPKPQTLFFEKASKRDTGTNCVC